MAHEKVGILRGCLCVHSYVHGLEEMTTVESGVVGEDEVDDLCNTLLQIWMYFMLFKVKRTNSFSWDTLLYLCKVIAAYSRDKTVRLRMLSGHLVVKEQQCSFEE